MPRLKERLVASAQTAVVAVDDDIVPGGRRPHRPQSGGSVVRVSARRPLPRGVFADGRDALRRRRRSGEAVRRRSPASGRSAAHTTPRTRRRRSPPCALLGIARRGDPVAGLRTFRGLPHRMEEVGRRGRVLFVNDSKATNADAAAKALASFERIYWIAGGRPKEGGIDGLADFFPRIAKAYLIGEAAGAFRGDARARGSASRRSGTLAAAVAAAARDAARDPAAEPVVLLSPACASYDQFPNFERRGDAFRAARAVARWRPEPGGGRLMVSRADRSAFRRVVVDRRQAAARRRLRPDGRRRGPVARRQPGRSPSASATTASTSSSATSRSSCRRWSVMIATSLLDAAPGAPGGADRALSSRSC